MREMKQSTTTIEGRILRTRPRGRAVEVMRLNLNLEREKLRALKELAAASGRTISLYVDELIDRELAKAARRSQREETASA